jgi:diketogulonate reductase-like aldo/keto reductase
VIIAFSPLAQGLLSGRYHGVDRPGGRIRETSPHFRPENIDRTAPLIKILREVADSHRATPAQIALAWVIRHPAVAAIPGASSVEQLESNAAAAEICLADDECEALHAASEWSLESGGLSPSTGRGLSGLKHCARGARYLARTFWHDLRTSSPRTLTVAEVARKRQRPWR